MRTDFKKAKTVLFSGMIAAAAFLLGGCEQSFFVSPSELLTPPASQKVTPTVVAVNTSTPTPVATATPTPTATNTPTPTPIEVLIPTATPIISEILTPGPTAIPTVPLEFEAPVTDPSDITFIVNREHPLPDKYEPDDLVYIKHAASSSKEDKYMLRAVAAEAFDAMCDDASANSGLNIVGVSGFRSFERQYNLYANYLITNGISHTNYYSAQPGTSEHQSGLAIDISCRSCGYDLVNSFARSAEGKWVSENAWRYGFILRYAENTSNITGYAYEPWHIRYVGIPLASFLYTNKLTLEEYYGCPSNESREYLDKTPLIDTSDAKFAKVYLQHYSSGGTVIYTDPEKKHVLIDPETYMPYILPYYKDANGKALKNVFGRNYEVKPVENIKGEVFPGTQKPYVAVRPLLYVSDILWYDSVGDPYYYEPLIDAKGNLIYDGFNKIMFKDVLMSADRTEVITDSEGRPITLVPKRDEKGEIVMDSLFNVEYYYPVTLANGEYAKGEDGALIWPEDYEDALYEELMCELLEESPLYRETVTEADTETEAVADTEAKAEASAE